jgi:lipopolysaccharide biosynthesis regulator YciM
MSSSVRLNVSSSCAVSLADKAFQTSKERSKEALEQSRQKIGEVSQELRDAYDDIEGRRIEYEKDFKEAEVNNTTPPSAENVELRNMEQLEADLETQKANLEMNLNTNPGVVEQYEKRKKEVCNSCLSCAIHSY